MAHFAEMRISSVMCKTKITGEPGTGTWGHPSVSGFVLKCKLVDVPSVPGLSVPEALYRCRLPTANPRRASALADYYLRLRPVWCKACRCSAVVRLRPRSVFSQSCTSLLCAAASFIVAGIRELTCSKYCSNFISKGVTLFAIERVLSPIRPRMSWTPGATTSSSMSPRLLDRAARRRPRARTSVGGKE